MSSPFVTTDGQRFRLFRVACLLAVLSLGCTKKTPYTLGEGESAPYEFGPPVKAHDETRDPARNDDWLTSISIVEPSAEAHSYQVGQPIHCVFEVQVPDGAPLPSVIMVEIAKGRTVYRTQWPDHVCRIKRDTYRVEVNFRQGLPRRGKYEIRVMISRLESANRPGSVGVVRRRVDAPPQPIEVNP
jgi:hypothetical protein